MTRAGSALEGFADSTRLQCWSQFCGSIGCLDAIRVDHIHGWCKENICASSLEQGRERLGADVHDVAPVGAVDDESARIDLKVTTGDTTVLVKAQLRVAVR